MARILDLVLPTLNQPTARGDDRENLNLAEYEVRLLLSIDLKEDGPR